MKKFEIAENEGQAILNYLMTQPYKEVVGMIKIISQLKEIKAENKKK